MPFEMVVDAPGVQIVDHGILASSRVIQDSTQERWEGSGIQFQPLSNAAPVGFNPANCAAPAADDMAAASQARGTVTVRPAAWQVTDSCTMMLVLNGAIDLAARNDITIGVGLQAQIEEELLKGAIAGVQDHTLIKDPTILNGGIGMSPSRAIGVLEEQLGNGRGGIGVIHAPSRVVSNWWSINGILTERANKIVTHTKAHVVIAGDGYDGWVPTQIGGPTGSAPATNQFWLYATGPTVVRLGPIRSYDPETDQRLVSHRLNAAYASTVQAAVAYHDNQRKFAVLCDLTLT